MKILVCVKQVPDTNEIKIDPVKNTLIREGVPSILNPFDSYAMEAALRLKDEDPDTGIVVLSMGPTQAKKVLIECLSVGADKAYLVSDRAFGGSDTLATSYIISQTIRKIEELEGYKFDMIFCGKQAIDGDTAQVGPEIAEHLDYPQVTYGLSASIQGDELYVRKEVEDGAEIIAVRFPCLITYTKPAYDMRYPKIRAYLNAKRADIPTITAADMADINLERCGLAGSPTKVKSTFVPKKKQGGVKLQGMDAAAAGTELFNKLTEAGVI